MLRIKGFGDSNCSFLGLSKSHWVLNAGPKGHLVWHMAETQLEPTSNSVFDTLMVFNGSL